MHKFRYFFLLIIVLISFIPTLGFAYQSLTLFSNEQEAQQHCLDNDEVVWLNTPTRIWHVKGTRWYANTKNGAFVCKQEAAMAGNRASKNG